MDARIGSSEMIWWSQWSISIFKGDVAADKITSLLDESTKRVENHIHDLREEQFKRLEDSGTFAEFVPMFAKMWVGINDHVDQLDTAFIPPCIMVGCFSDKMAMYTGMSLRQFNNTLLPRVATDNSIMPTFATLHLKRGDGTCTPKPLALREGTSPGTEIPFDILDLLYQKDDPMAPVVLFSVASIAFHYHDKGWVYTGSEAIEQHSVWKHPVVAARFTNGLK